MITLRVKREKMKFVEVKVMMTYGAAKVMMKFVEVKTMII